jgi:hypothetical protein
MVRQYFDRSRLSGQLPKALTDPRYPGIWYLWDSASPLVKYTILQEGEDSIHQYFRSWMRQGSLYSAYGAWLVRTYPGAYVQHFVTPNAFRYVFPYLEFLGDYNSGVDTVQPVANHFFGFSENHLAHVLPGKFQAKWMHPYQMVHLVVNLFFALILVLYVVGGDLRGMHAGFGRYMIPAVLYWIFNLLFIVFTAPVVLRYEVAPMMVCLFFSLVAADRLAAAPVKRAAVLDRLGESRKSLIVDICAFSLCFLFVYAASAKLLNLDVFLVQLERFPWLTHVSKAVGWMVPLTELGIAGLLLSGRQRRLGLLAALALMLAFTIYLLLMLGSGQHLPCSCGGVISSLSWGQHIWFNLLFILMAGAGLFIYHHKKQMYET